MTHPECECSDSSRFEYPEACSFCMATVDWSRRDAPLMPDPYGCPYLGTLKPCPLCDCERRKRVRMVDSEVVARMIERAEIAPGIKQRLIAEIIELEGGK